MRTALVVPTYQEAGNIERFLKEVRAVLPDMTVIVCDDNSPDGTGDIADRMAAELGSIDVVHRAGKEGLGAAYRHGLTYALDAGYDLIMQMDVDFSHDPALLPHCARRSSMVPTSCRLPVRAGRLHPDWPMRRRMPSRYGNSTPDAC